MKKNRLNSLIPERRGKLWLVMRLTLFLIVVSVMNLGAENVSAQKSKLSINVKDATIKEVLDQIEKESDYYFYYKSDASISKRKISGNFENLSIIEILDQVLVGTQLAYKVVDNYIAILPATAPDETYNRQQQELKVKGIVTDDKGDPLPGVNIFDKEDPTNGVITGVDGSYSITIGSGDVVLTYSFIGFVTQELHVAGRSTINITLMEDVTGLEEVVVTALGVSKQPRALGYATSKLKTNEILQTNTVNPINALQGKVAGVNINVIGTSGVTSSSSITIRGAKSIGKNNSPIFVIDGIVMENNVTDTYGGKDWGSQLKNLNPDDYESVTVLKGAAATALYGSRGANGAIVIVSKGGKARQGIGVEVSQTNQIQSIYKAHMDLQNEYGMGYGYNGYQGGYLPDGSLSKTTSSYGPKMDGSMRDQYYLDGEKTPFSAHPDNWKALYQDGFYNNTNVALNGGNEKANYRLSYSFMDNKGVLKNNRFSRHSINFKTSAELNKIFSIDFGVNYVNSKARNAYDQGFWREGQNLGLMTIYYMPRNLDLEHFYETYRDPENNSLRSQPVYGKLANFLHRLDYYNETRNEESVLANLTLKAQITNIIDASAKLNYNMYNTFNRRTEYGAGPYLSGGGYYGVQGSRRGNYNALFMVHGSKKFMNDDLEVDVRIANEIYGNTKNESWGKNTNGGLIVPGLFAFSNSVNTIYPWYNYTPEK